MTGKRVLRIGPEGTMVYIGGYYEILYPSGAGSGKYKLYEPNEKGTPAAVRPICTLICPDGELDPIRCRCIYPTPPPPRPTPIPIRTPTPMPTPTSTPTPTPTPLPGAAITKYYYAGGQRVAMRQGPVGQAGTVSYLHTDHLGSTTLLSDPAGNPVPGSAVRYRPYGEERYAIGTLHTDRRFTSQRWDDALGL